ncbi:hypothetical protein HWV62_9383 [Athelia sp. TMB]|nr:hypothetical protein HWV62_9383 [Athelia sp. TMB]
MSDDEGGKKSGYRLEYAASARAKCKGPKPCQGERTMTAFPGDADAVSAGTPIGKGELRVGTLVDIGGNTSFAWRHWGCITPKILSNMKKSFGEAAELDGYDELRAEDRARVDAAWAEGRVADADVPESARKPAKDGEDDAEEKPKKKRAPAKKKAKAASDAEEDEEEKPKRKRAPAKKKAKAASDAEDEEEEEKPKKKRAPPKKAAEKAKAAPKKRAPKKKKVRIYLVVDWYSHLTMSGLQDESDEESGEDFTAAMDEVEDDDEPEAQETDDEGASKKRKRPASKSKAAKPASKKSKPSSSRAKKSKAVSEDDDDE